MGKIGVNLCLCLALLGLTRCSEEPLHPLRVSVHNWPGYELLFLARALHQLPASAIRLIDSPSASETSRALRNGTVEAGAVTLDEALTLLQDQVDIQIVMVFDASHGADVLITSKHIKQLADLKGKRIGVEVNAVGAYMLDAALRSGGLTVDDVSLVPLTLDSHLRAWHTQALDGIVTFEPVKTALLSEDNHVLFDSSALPLPLLDVLVVRREALIEHASAIQALLQGYFNALATFQQRRNVANQLIADRLQLSAPQTAALFDGLKLYDLPHNALMLAQTPTPCARLLAIAEPLQTLMLSRHLLRHASPLNDFCAPHPLMHLTPPSYAHLHP